MNKIYLDELYKVFLSIRNKKEAQILFKDIFTPQELEALVQRWQIIKMLKKGVPHRKISKSLHVSISKVTRGSTAIRRTSGGFALALKRA